MRFQPASDGPSDEYRPQADPPDALIFRLQALLIRAGSILPEESCLVG